MNAIEQLGSNAINVLKKDAPKLLVGSGIASGIGATVLCGVNTVKAVRAVDDIQRDPKYDEYDKKSMAKVYAKTLVPLYAPVVILSAGSVACNVSGFSLQTKRLTNTIIAATEAAEMARGALYSYKKHAEEVMSDEQKKKVEDAVAQEQTVKAKAPDDILITKGGNQLFRDSITGQYFWSTREAVSDALVEFNLRMPCEGFINLDEWCDMLDIEHVATGNRQGWDDRYMPLRIDYVPVIAPNGVAALQLSYSVLPVVDYIRKW